jgi:AraC-like DNA-binding protein
LKEIFEPIRSHYVFSAPCGELAQYVEFYAESIINEQIFTVEMFPSWTPTIYINLGNPYRISIGDFVTDVSENTDLLVLRDLKTTRHNFPGDHIFTLKFNPGGLEATLGISQIQFRQQVVPLKGFFPPELLTNIKNADSFDARKTLVENYLLKKRGQQRADHYLTFVQDLANEYQANGMQYNVSQLAEKYFTTSKTVNRYFNRVVGISPKNYFSIVRARQALTAYAANEQIFNPCDFGYYDGSHFYKEAVKFTGGPLRLIQ